MLPWIQNAQALIGLREIKGAQHAPEILQMWRDIKRGGIKDDETPWCAAFVGAMLERAGIVSSRFESARSYEKWGVAIPWPIYGCVVVFTRSGGGHVGFCVGNTPSGNLLILGGNQSDEVNVRVFTLDRVTAYRWPASWPMPDDLALPMGNAELSVREA
ncbi:TIGR02594 family protein [Chrysiogenes arsenatis]|uniref:TIGR02594 family protein n=1 Tax=Chrysiogenes arsenatis TaxID=309797 RepID=UPI0004075C51|nr:TIGR02594 family protein [Chrysiogenes arsenatis]